MSRYEEARVQYSRVYMLIHAARLFVSKSKFNYLLWCDTGGDFKQFASKRQDRNNPQPPLHKKHPLDLKSKQPKWLDEIRATLPAVKLNRICAC